MNSANHTSQAHLDEVLILMYHRIADPDLDPWSLCVSPENFAQHLETLSQCCEFIMAFRGPSL